MSDAETGQRNLTPSALPEGEPPETYRELAMDYPVGLIAGGLAVGILAGALIPRGTGRKLAEGAASLAVLSAKTAKRGQQASDAPGAAAEVQGPEGPEDAAASRKGQDLMIGLARSALQFLADRRR